MRQVVLDTETTGLQPEQGHRVIEIGCVELINRRPTGRTFHQYLNPEREIDAGAQEVHGLSLEFLSDKPVFAVISDVGASGAYYIAASADEVFADRASLVGSIGVISAGFGFVDLLEKLGLERRVFTAGSHKALLDAFTPIKEDEAQFWNGVLEQTHRQFVERVKEGRGQRLSDSDTVFSGLIWSGEEALELGLIDGFSSSRELARARFDTETLLDYTPKRHPLQQMASTLGASVAETLYGRVLGGATPVLR